MSCLWKSLVKRIDLIETDTAVFSEVAELFAILVQLRKIDKVLIDFVKLAFFRGSDEKWRCVSAFNSVFPWGWLVVGGRSDSLNAITKSKRLELIRRKLSGVRAIFVGLALPVVMAVASGSIVVCFFGPGSFIAGFSELLLLACKESLLLTDKRKVGQLELEDSWIAHREGVCA